RHVKIFDPWHVRVAISDSDDRDVIRQTHDGAALTRQRLMGTHSAAVVTHSDAELRCHIDSSRVIRRETNTVRSCEATGNRTASWSHPPESSVRADIDTAP